ncbi:HTH-type transcriptional activator RhaR [bioreactor metagenome]|uniref:HTH-type transcriptional activator RhaR n=1 Tax=bioreactor metagenome TaxID=1076179 RepID=A0A644UQV4_9ZZZZ|nr:AraC family transcriptional regulator [Desulfovibrio desulfuricans]MEA4991646.1 AraC family transcriptional regulator [Desulfovibrio desulfuricans]
MDVVNSTTDAAAFAASDVYRMAGATPLPLKQGLALQFAQVPSAGRCRAEFAIGQSPLIFGFMLAGLNCCRYTQGSLGKSQCVHTSGSNRITYLPETSGTLDCKGGMQRLSILVAPEFLEEYLEIERAKLPKGLAGAIKGDNAAFQWIGRRCPLKMGIVADVLGTAYAGPLRRLHLEARTLELIGLQLAEYLYPVVSLSPPKLAAVELSRIRDAREILLQDMENPPSLGQLSKLSGLNEKKLKYGFKQVFGMPVFEYFRSYRLEMARELLASGMMNVTEVGMHIGYQSLSHFSREFHNKFGVTPKKFQTCGKG